MFLLTPVLPGIVLFKATYYGAEIRQLIAKARKDVTKKPSQVLVEVQKIEGLQLIHQRIYYYSRIIEATLETEEVKNVNVLMI